MTTKHTDPQTETVHRHATTERKVDANHTSIKEDLQIILEACGALQNSPGPNTPQDQSSLDTLKERVQVLSRKLESHESYTTVVHR